MVDECEHCGISKEDYMCDFEAVGGEMLCEDCAENAKDDMEDEVENE